MAAAGTRKLGAVSLSALGVFFLFARYITESGPASSRCLGGSVRQELAGRLRSFKAATGGATSG